MYKFISPAKRSRKNINTFASTILEYPPYELNTEIKTWTIQELNQFLALCLSRKHYDYACIACLEYHHKFTISECFEITVSQAVKTIKSNVLVIKNEFRPTYNIYVKEAILKVCFMKLLEKPSKIYFSKLLDTPLSETKLFAATDNKMLSVIKKYKRFVKSHSPRGRFDV